MIITSKTISSWSYLKIFTSFFKSFIMEIRILFIAKQLATDRVNLKKYFKQFYPSLTKGLDLELSCVGCNLCQEVCPTMALKLEFPKLVNFPLSLKVGELPIHFYLDLDVCIQCGYCKQICPVEAIGMQDRMESRIVINQVVDLVATENH